jgi:hypothetical protein
VVDLKPDLAKFSHPLDQSGQAWCHRGLAPFVFDKGGGGGKKLVHPLRFDIHIHKKPLLLRVFSRALEGGINVLVIAGMMK